MNYDYNIKDIVNINKYLGKWYEIARYPHWFEEGCFNSTAFYEKLKDGQIDAYIPNIFSPNFLTIFPFGWFDFAIL